MKNNIVLIVLKKELTDMFRDKKNIILSILIPLILFPTLSFIMGKTQNDSTNKVESNFNIAIKDEGSSSLSKFIKNQKNVNIIKSSDMKKDVKSGKIYIGIDIPKNFDEDVKGEVQVPVTVIYDNSSQNGEISLSKVNSYIDAYSKQITAERLSKRNIDIKLLTPVSVVSSTIDKESEGTGKMLLSLMLPLLLIMYCFTATVGPAVDLGAGEKERGTLEPLLTTRAGRMSLLWGKFFAITIMGVLMTLSSLIGILIALKSTSGLFGMAKGEVHFDIATILLIIIVPILTTMVSGAFELAISIYARSFKEAQTYLSPVTIISMVLVYSTIMLDGKNIDTYFFHIPIANLTCIIKEFIMGIHNPYHIVITFAWLIVYVVASLLFARYMFSREEVVFRT